MSSSSDAAVLAVAVPQHGAFTIGQARLAGMTYPRIARRVAAGTWRRGPGDVLQLPGFPPSFVQRLWWALLLGGEGAYVSHWSALALHRASAFPPTRLMITVPHPRRHDNPVARVFQTTAVTEPVRIQGLPVAPLARSLVDAGRLVGPLRLGSAVDEVVADGKLTLATLQKEFLALAASGRNGITTMRAVLEVRAEDAYVPPRATLERHLDRVLRRLPVAFEVEAPLPGREWSKERVDRLCRAPRPLVVEGDGRRYHTRVRDFPRDARRRRDALAAGFPTVNYLYEELRDDPDAVEVELRRVLGLS